MKNRYLLTIFILLFYVLHAASCRKDKIFRYSGLATTAISEIRYENGNAYHFQHFDTLQFELTVNIDRHTIEFISANDSIVKSHTFQIQDSVNNNNTYITRDNSKNTTESRYRVQNDSLAYSFKHQVWNSINSYTVTFAGKKK